MTNPRKYLPLAPWALAAAIVATSVALAPPAIPDTQPGPAAAISAPVPTAVEPPPLDVYDMGPTLDGGPDAVGACLLALGHAGRSDGSEARLYAPWPDIEWCAERVRVPVAPGDGPVLDSYPSGGVLAT